MFKTYNIHIIMAFKISPSHERNFQNIAQNNQPQEIIEETVYILDDDTGELVEEKQMVPNQNVQSSSIVLPKTENKFIGLAMRKKSKVSFM